MINRDPDISSLKELQSNEIWKTSYSAVGFSNEKTTVVVGTASGNLSHEPSETEEIEARWYTKDEIKHLLTEEHFAARTQAYCALWCKS